MLQTAEHSPRSDSRCHCHRWYLLFLVLAALVLRVVYNTCELPPVYIYPNEEDKRNFTLGIEGRDRFRDLSMPSFLYNSTWLIYQSARVVYNIGHDRAPNFAPFKDIMVFYIWVGRVYMAVCGAIGVWLIYHLGKRLGSRRIGLIAATLLAVAPIHVLGSRHMKEDMPLGLFCTGAIIVMLDLIRRRAVRDYVRSAAMVGLCMSAKWLGLIMAIPFALAHFLARRRHPEIRYNRKPAWWTAVIAGSFALGFFIASPDYLLRIGDLNNAFSRGIGKAYSAHADGMSVSPMTEALTDYWRTGLWPGLTPALLALAIVGAIWLARRKPDEALLVGFWVVFFLFLLETARARPYPHYQRYLQPIILCVVAFSACGVEALIQLCQRFVPRRQFATAVCITLLAAAWPACDTARYLSQIPHSTIIQAYNYINSQVPPDSVIITDGYGPLLDRAKFKNQIRYRKKDRLNFAAFPTGPSYVLYSSQGLGRYLEHPDAVPEMTRFVHYVLGQGKLVQEWRPGFRSFYAENPTIQLYYLERQAQPFVPNQPSADAKSRDDS